MPRDTTIHLRIDSMSRDRLFAAAATAGCSASSWLRGVASSAAAAGDNGIRLADELALLRRELGRVGSNLNQIARVVNTNGTVDASELHDVLTEIEDVSRAVSCTLAHLKS